MDRRYIKHSTESAPERVRALLSGKSDWAEAGYASRFAARKAVLSWMVRGGWSQDQAYRFIFGPRVQADLSSPVSSLWGSESRFTPDSAKLREFLRDWEQAVIFCGHLEDSRYYRPDVLRICGELRSAIAEHPWKGQAGRTDRAVLLVAIAFAEQSGWLRVKLAAREVALKAGCLATTVSRSLARLVKAGWLEKVQVEKLGYGEGQPYLIVEARAWKKLSYCIIDTDIDYNPDSCLYRSCNKRAMAIIPDELGILLGKAAVDILLVLDQDMPMRASEAARRAQVSPATASRQLKRMAALRPHGLVLQQGKGWILGKQPEDYEPVLHELRAAKRRARYEAERTEYHGARTMYLRRRRKAADERTQARIEALRRKRKAA